MSTLHTQQRVEAMPTILQAVGGRFTRLCKIIKLIVGCDTVREFNMGWKAECSQLNPVYASKNTECKKNKLKQWFFNGSCIIVAKCRRP